MRSINLIRGVEKKVKQINEYIQSDGKAEFNIETKGSGFFILRFDDRLKYWKDMLQKVENANEEKYKYYTEEWIKFMGCHQKTREISEEFLSVKGEFYDKNKNFVYPYSAAITFYNKLADVFYKLGIWYEFLNRMYETSFISIRHSSIFTYKTNGIYEKETITFYGDKFKKYHLPLTKKLDRFLICASECLFYALGGYSYLDNFPLDGKIDSDTYVKGLGILTKAIDAGLGAIYITEEEIGYSADCKVRINSKNELHCSDGPAVQNVDGRKGYYYNGIAVDEKVIMHPEQINPKEVLTASNRLIKEVMIEKMGLGKFVESINYFVLDELSNGNEVYQLIQVDIDELNPLIVMKVFCPSTKRAYYLRVPHNISTFKQALQWTFGNTSINYNMYIET